MNVSQFGGTAIVVHCFNVCDQDAATSCQQESNIKFFEHTICTERTLNTVCSTRTQNAASIDCSAETDTRRERPIAV